MEFYREEKNKAFSFNYTFKNTIVLHNKFEKESTIEECFLLNR